MPTTTPRPRPARERLLEAAAELFYAHGMAATGIDAITERAGVARKSLYNNFASKEDLVLAYLEARHREWLDLHERRAATARTPRERVLAVFDAYLDHAGAAYVHGFRGCGLLNAAAELPAGSPGRDAVRRHKEQVEEILADALAGAIGSAPATTGIDASGPGQATMVADAAVIHHAGGAASRGGADAGAGRAPALAEQLAFLLEGAVARAGLEGSPERLVHARAIAAAWLDAA